LCTSSRDIAREPEQSPLGELSLPRCDRNDGRRAPPSRRRPCLEAVRRFGRLGSACAQGPRCRTLEPTEASSINWPELSDAARRGALRSNFPPGQKPEGSADPLAG